MVDNSNNEGIVNNSNEPSQNNELKRMIEKKISDLTEQLGVIRNEIQELKTIGRGYRTFANFRSAILFFHGGLNLYPLSSW